MCILLMREREGERGEREIYLLLDEVKIFLVMSLIEMIYDIIVFLYILSCFFCWNNFIIVCWCN